MVGSDCNEKGVSLGAMKMFQNRLWRFCSIPIKNGRIAHITQLNGMVCELHLNEALFKKLIPKLQFTPNQMFTVCALSHPK